MIPGTSAKDLLRPRADSVKAKLKICVQVCSYGLGVWSKYEPEFVEGAS